MAPVNHFVNPACSIVLLTSIFSLTNNTHVLFCISDQKYSASAVPAKTIAYKYKSSLLSTHLLAQAYTNVLHRTYNFYKDVVITEALDKQLRRKISDNNFERRFDDSFGIIFKFVKLQVRFL